MGLFIPSRISIPRTTLQSGDPGTFGHGEETFQTHFAKIARMRRSRGSPQNGSPLKTANPITFGSRPIFLSGRVLPSAIASATAFENFFNWAKANNFAIGTVFSLIILGGIILAQKRDLFIRRIAGLEALDEALGRATEMGKPVLFCPRLGDDG